MIKSEIIAGLSKMYRMANNPSEIDEVRYHNEIIDAAIAAIKPPYESQALSLCRCGTKIKPKQWLGHDDNGPYSFYKCTECMFAATKGKNQKEAREHWNEEVRNAE